MFRSGFFGSQVDATDQLTAIKRTCGIFLEEAQYQKILTLPDSTINVLFENRDKFKSVMFFNGNLFNTLLLLTTENLRAFFNGAKIGPAGNAEVYLNTLYQRQCAVFQQQLREREAAAAVVVVVQQAPAPVGVQVEARVPVYQQNPFAQRPPYQHTHFQQPHVHSHVHVHVHSHGHEHGHGNEHGHQTSFDKGQSPHHHHH